MTGRRPIESVGISLWIAIALVSVFLVGGLIDITDRGPRVGRVRLDDLAAEYVGQVSRMDASDEDVAASARAWAEDLERALHRVAERHGVVLLPAEVVAAGAPDYTGEVRSAMPGREMPPVAVIGSLGATTEDAP